MIPGQMGTMEARVGHYYDVSSRVRRLVCAYVLRLVTQPRNAAHAPCLDCLSDSVARFSINNTIHTRACTYACTQADSYECASPSEFAYGCAGKQKKNDPCSSLQCCEFDSIRREIFEKEEKNGGGGELIDRRSFTVRLDTDVRLYNFEKKRLS